MALNGGLFGSADKAASDTQMEAEKEQLLSSVATAYEAETRTISKSKLEANLGTGWSLAEGDTAPYTVTSPRGNKFTVNSNGTIDSYKGIILASSTTTINKVGGTAEITATLEGVEGEVTWTSSDEETATIVGNGNKATITAVKNGTVTITATCGGKTANIVVTVEILPDGLEEGSEVELDADKDGTKEQWIVLYKEEGYIELISKNTMGSVTLGYDDPVAVKNATDIDEDESITDIDKAIYSFEHSVDTLNNYCDNLIKIENIGVRSAGSNPNNPSYVNTNHTDDSFVTLLGSWSDAARQKWNKYKMLVGTADTNYEKDFNKMEELNIKASDEDYWLASRYIKDNSSGAPFKAAVILGGIMTQRSWKEHNTMILIYFKGTSSEGNVDVKSFTYRVRPVIKLQYP